MDIVVICNDCLRHDYVTKEYMPNLATLAEGGAVFNHCFSGGGGTLTSLPYFLSSQTIYDPNKNLFTILQSQGYKTAMIHSNLHLNTYNHGLDVCVDLISTLTYSITWELRKLCNVIGEQWWVRLMNLRQLIMGKEELIRQLRERPYIRAGLSLQTCKDWLEITEGNKFLWVHIMDTHIPYSPIESSMDVSPERALELYNKILASVYKKDVVITPQEREDIKSLYADEVRYLDKELGEFIRGLSDALVIVTSDHGDEFGEYGGYSHGGLEYHGLIPQLIHVPLIFLGKQIKPVIIERDMSTMDVAPTILDLVGISERFGYGNSLKRLIKSPRRDKI